MLSSIWKAVLILSFSGTAASIPLLLLKRSLLKRYNGKWYYYIWLFALLTFAVPVGYTVMRSNNKLYFAAYGIQSASLALNEPSAIETLVLSALRDASSVILSNAAGFVWLFGTLLFLAGNILAYRVFTGRIMRRSVPVAAHAALDALQEIRAGMNIKSSIRLISSTEADSPMLVGLFRPTVVLPDAVLQDEQADFELIMTHELTHHKNADILYKYIILFIQSVHWFNPLIYIVAKTVNEACDYACDYAVTKRKGHQFSLRYAHMLLNTMRQSVSHRQTTSCLAAHLFQGKRNMKRRFELIMMNSNKRNVGVTAFVLAAVLGISVYTTVMASTALNDSGIAGQKLSAVTLSTEPDADESQNARLKTTEESIEIPLYVLADNGNGGYKLMTEDGEEIELTITLPENVNVDVKNAKIVTSNAKMLQNADSGKDEVVITVTEGTAPEFNLKQ